MAKNLVLYYSRKGQNYVNGTIRHLEKGNTEVVAEYIRDAVGADLFEIETLREYSADYMTCTEEAKQEIRENARPELRSCLDNLDGYENIVIAGPCWWGTYPYAVFSQLERLDFTGKNVFVVMTHEGSGLADSERDVRRFCKGASLGRSLAVHGGSVAKSEATVSTWARSELLN